MGARAAWIHCLIREGKGIGNKILECRLRFIDLEFGNYATGDETNLSS